MLSITVATDYYSKKHDSQYHIQCTQERLEMDTDIIMIVMNKVVLIYHITKYNVECIDN